MITPPKEKRKKQKKKEKTWLEGMMILIAQGKDPCVRTLWVLRKTQGGLKPLNLAPL